MASFPSLPAHPCFHARACPAVGTPRTLSGRPSPIIAPSLSLSPTHRVVTIGAPSSMLLNPTLSENHDRTERARRSHEGPR